MNQESDSNDNRQPPDKNPLPVAKIPPATLPVKPIEPLAPSPIVQQNIAARLPGDPSSDGENKNHDPLPVCVMNDPLLTRVVRDDELSTFENRTLKYARWGFLVAIVTLLIAVGTGIVFYEQFSEMANQTDLLARAARQARSDAKDAGILAGKQLTIAHEQVQAAQKQVVAAQQSVAAIQRQTLQQERPWIATDVALAQNLVFDERGAVTGINVTLSNKGHSAAMFTSVWSALVVDGVDDWLGEQKRLCGIPKLPVNKNSNTGQLIFPDQSPVVVYQPAIARPDKVNKGVKKGIDSGWFNREGKIGLHIVVCVDYLDTADARHHQTRSLFGLSYPERHGNFLLDMGAFDPHTTYDTLNLFPVGLGASAD